MTAHPQYDHAFWTLAGTVADLLGPLALKKLLMLYLAVQHPATPTWAKIQATGVITGLIGPSHDGAALRPYLTTNDIAFINASIDAIQVAIPSSIPRSADDMVMNWMGWAAA